MSGAGLGAVGHGEDCGSQVDAQPAQRLRFPAAGGRTYQREIHQAGTGTADQVRQAAPGQVRGRHAVADVPSGAAVPGAPVEPDGRVPVPGDAEVAAPPVVQARAGERREQVEQDPPQHAVHPRVTVERRPDPRPEVVRRPAAAEGDPPVLRALAVDAQMPLVAECLTPGKPQLIPGRVRQRFGPDHEGVHRHHVPVGAGQVRRVALGGADDDLGVDAPVRGVHGVRLQAGDRGPLVDLDAEPVDDVGKTAYETGRVQGGAMRCVRTAEDVRGTAACGGLRGVEQADLLAEAPVMPPADLGPGAIPLRTVAGERYVAAVGEAAVDLLLTYDPAHLLHGAVHRALETARSLGVRTRRHLAHGGRVDRRAPAPVAAGSAEPGRLAFQHDHPYGRIGALEVVRGPQPGEPGPDDDHVGGSRPGKRGPWHDPSGIGVVPQAE